MFDIVNLHNFGFTRAQVLIVGAHLDRLFIRDRAQPDTSFSLLVGDVNFRADDEQRFKVGRPLAPSSLWHSTQSGTHETLWKSFLSKWCELAQPFPTHFSSDSLSSSRLDRGWLSSPTNQILNLRISASTAGTPEEFEANRISDHCPVAYYISPRLPTGGTSLSIPRKICIDPFFLNVSPASPLQLIWSINFQRIFYDYIMLCYLRPRGGFETALCFYILLGTKMSGLLLTVFPEYCGDRITNLLRL